MGGSWLRVGAPVCIVDDGKLKGRFRYKYVAGLIVWRGTKIPAIQGMAGCFLGKAGITYCDF